MGSPYAFTDLLSAVEAKKLYFYLTQPNASVKWSDEGGASREVKLRNVASSALSEITLPKFCSDIHISVTDQVTQRRKDNLPSSYFLGGDDWFPPEYGDKTRVTIMVVVRELNYPIEIGFTKSSGERFNGKSYNRFSQIGVSYPNENSWGFKHCTDMLTFGERPPLDVRREYLDKLVSRFEFPNKDTPGILEDTWDHVQAEPGYRMVVAPESCEWSRGSLQAMMKELIEDSPSEYYSIYVNVSVGIICQFKGERHNVDVIAKDLLERIANVNDFDFYDVTYGEVGPCTWSQVAKGNQKVNEPTVAELGVITLEDGVEGSVSLTTYESGYRFYITFDGPENLLSFFVSDLFRRANWNCDEF